MKTKLIFGDIHGRAREVLKIIAQYPDAELISVGDMIDRGPASKQVLELFQARGRAILGNHEHMLVDAYYNERFEHNYGQWLLKGESYYNCPTKNWLTNGGIDTLACFAPAEEMGPINTWYALGDTYAALDIKYAHGLIRKYIPESLVEWLASLPMYIKEDGLLITHAAKNPILSLEQCCDLGDNCFTAECENSLLWNRGKKRPIDGIFQVHGHMSHRSVQWAEDKSGNRWGVNLDTCKGNVTSCLLYPHGEIIQENWECTKK